MNTEKKKRISISIGITPDVLEKLERINQDEYYGHMKIKNIMLSIIDIGLLAVDYWGTCRRTVIALESYTEEKEKEQKIERELEEEQEEPVLEKIIELMGNPGENGTVLESPIGKLLVAPRPIDQQASDLNRRWTFEDFEKIIKEKGLYGYRIAAWEGGHGYWSNDRGRDCFRNKALLYLNDGERRFRAISYDGKNGELRINESWGMYKRYLYHQCPNKLISWIELFPDANPCPYEKKYLAEATGEKAEGAKP